MYSSTNLVDMEASIDHTTKDEQHLSMEESALKHIKKELKQIFADMEEDKQSFDTIKDNLQRHRLAQTAEKRVMSAEELLRKYEF